MLGLLLVQITTSKWINNTSSSYNTGVCGNAIQITFNTMGGYMDAGPTACANYNFKYGRILKGGLPKPSKTGYDFVGWYTDRVGGSLVTDETRVTDKSDHTLYARWVSNGTGASGQLALGDYQMKCVYDNGASLTFYSENGMAGIDIDNINLKGALSIDFNTSMNYFYRESEVAKAVLNDMTCPSSIGVGVYVQKDVDGNTQQFLVYAIPDDDEIWSSYDSFASTQIITGFYPVSGEWAGMPTNEVLHERAINRSDTFGTAFSFYLVNEKIEFTNAVVPRKTYTYKSSGSQAVSKVMYMKIKNYISPIGAQIALADKDGEITKLEWYSENGNRMAGYFYNDNKAEDTINNMYYVCFKNASQELVSDGTSTAFAFTGVRHVLKRGNKVYSYKDYGTDFNIASDPNATCSARYTGSSGYSLYQLFSTDDDLDGETTKTSLCDIAPSTVIYIGEIINWLQILVPALLIIYTAVDISKIVITGNIEEELPKRKKNIIIRAIVSLIFFFLPLLVSVLFSIIYTSDKDVDFGDYSCIYKQNSTSDEEKS